MKPISRGVIHTVPADLQKALISDAAALAKWEDITPLARNEWICWVISVKKLETRRQHIERVRTELKEGIRRRAGTHGTEGRNPPTLLLARLSSSLTNPPLRPSANRLQAVEIVSVMAIYQHF